MRTVCRIWLSIFTLVLCVCMCPAFAGQKGKAKSNQTEATAAGGAEVVPGGTAGNDEQKAVSTSAVPEETPAADNQKPAPRKASRGRNSTPVDAAKPLEPIVPVEREIEAAPPAVLDAHDDVAASASPAAAVPPATVISEPNGPVQSGWMDIVKLAGGIGLVISLMLGGYIVFRKYGPQYLAKGPAQRTLRVIESVSMGEKRSVAIVQAGSKKFLVASTPGQITLLTALADEPAAEPAQPAPAPKFHQLYELEKKNVVPRPASRAELPPDIRGKMQQLRKALEG